MEKQKSDELLKVQTENRHLKDTIRALREELEKEHYRYQEGIQKAVSAANDDNIQLKKTISAIRDEMEKMRFDRIEIEQEARAGVNDEITQLKLTIKALREELESQKIFYENKLQNMASCGQDGKKNKRKMIKALQKKSEDSHGA